MELTKIVIMLEIISFIIISLDTFNGNLWREVLKIFLNLVTCTRESSIWTYGVYKLEGVYEEVQTKEPNETILVDFYGPIPASVRNINYIFVILDLFFKLVTLYPKEKADQYFVNFAKSKKVLSDNKVIIAQMEIEIGILGYKNDFFIYSSSVIKFCREIGEETGKTILHLFLIVLMVSSKK